MTSQKQYYVSTRSALAGLGNGFIQSLPTRLFGGVVPTFIYVDKTAIPDISAVIETVNLSNNILEFVPEGYVSAGGISITSGNYANNTALAAQIEIDINTFADANYAAAGYANSIIVIWNLGTLRYEISSAVGNFTLRFDSSNTIGTLLGFGMVSNYSGDNLYAAPDQAIDVSPLTPPDEWIYIISDIISTIDVSNIDPSLNSGRRDILYMVYNNIGNGTTTTHIKLPVKYGEIVNNVRNNNNISFPLFGLRLPSGRAITNNIEWSMTVVFETVV